MNVCSLGSGSAGNCLLVEEGRTRLLVDLGFSCRHTKALLGAVGVEMESISGVRFTHDHSDHYSALDVFHRHHPQIPLLATDGTAVAIARRTKVEDGWTTFETGGEFTVGDISVESFSVPHDAADPVGYLFTCEDTTLFVATDFGTVTEPVRQAFRRANCAVLESNHDPELLAKSGRPQSLKQRISGRSGHLSNDDACDLIRTIRPPALRKLFLAHLSSECNESHMAVRMAREAAVSAGLRDLVIEPLCQSVLCCDL